MNINRFDNLMSIVEKIKEIYDIKESMRSGFNIFKVLDNMSDEVNLHSKLICELLGNRKYNGKYIQLFFQSIGLQVDERLIDRAVVMRERSFSNGRIDILIEMYNDKDKKAIIIENKIYADDVRGQLNRYYKSVKNLGYDDGQIEIIYLTLFGDTPSDDSIKNLKHEVKCISYSEDINKWIEACIRESAEIPEVREILIQYRDVIKILTYREEDEMVNDIKIELMKNLERYECGLDISKAVLEVKKEQQYVLWSELERRLSEVNSIKLVDDEKFLSNKNKHYSKKLINDYYEKNVGAKTYGITYFVKNIEDIGDIYIRIEMSDLVFFGIRKSLGTLNKSEKYKSLLINLKEAGFNGLDTQWWVGWKFFNLTPNLYVKTMNTELVGTLIDDENRDAMMNRIAEQIEDLIRLINRV
ncbi:MAG: PD-(D/E)XK nuclease family protein [Tissierellia bacterium]|nr:PD-(D/E)XK nuclease family protein [Tissierellia bacterium]